MSLHDFIRARRAELARLAEQLSAKLKQIEVELEEIDTAARAVGIEIDHSDMARLRHGSSIKSTPVHRHDLTIKDAAALILEDAPGGLTANEILNCMRDRFGLHYPRSSLSPQLSRLKYDGVVGRKDGRWVLEKFLENEVQD